MISSNEWHFRPDRRRLLEIHKSNGLSDLGSVKPELVVCMVFTFCLLYLSLFKGVKSSGKVSCILDLLIQSR